MELLYFWLHDFRNIKQQGFDFSGEINFSVTHIETVGSKLKVQLHAKLNPNHINLFPKSIINITGAIGANASGKSNLLDAIKLLCGRMSDITSGLFFCVKDPEQQTIHTYYYAAGGLKSIKMLQVVLQVDDSLGKKYKVFKPVGYNIKKDTKNFNQVAEFGDKVPVGTCCYLTNTFDSRNESFYSNIFNASTNNRIERYANFLVSPEGQRRVKNNEKRIHSPLMAGYHRRELRTLLSFIAAAKSKTGSKLPDLPGSIVINFNFHDLEYTVEEFGEHSTLFEKEDLNRLHKNAMETLIGAKANWPKAKAMYHLVILCSFYYALRWDIFKNRRMQGSAISTVIKGFSNVKGEQLFKQILKFLSSFPLRPSKEKENTIRRLLGPNMKEAIDNVTFLADSATDPLRFRLSIQQELWPFLDLVFSFRYMEPVSFMDYQWENLSSGQEAFFLQFGRLYEMVPDIPGDTIWLLIDEGDLYFHPQWQKDYIKRLTEFIGFIFSDKKVQIILTSHSPFIASDLPRTNLIFLQRKENNLCEVTDIRTHEKTFGANIHMLYTDSFFLDSVIGSFAKEKIDEFIKWTKTKDSPLDTDGTRWRFLTMIGEPIVRAKLTELYHLKMGTDIELNQLIALRSELDNQINKLNQRK